MAAAKLNDKSELTIPLRNLIALVIGTAAFVMAYFNLTERLSILERGMELQSVQVEANSEFRVLWPRGELGALPDDAEQNQRLNYIEQELDELTESLR